MKPANTTAPRLGCMAILLSLVAVGAVLWEKLPNEIDLRDLGQAVTQGGLDSVRTQQELLLDEQTKAAREQTRRLYQERILLRRQRIQLIADRHETDKGDEYDKIGLVNRCPHDIAVAINYLDLDDEWIVRGWWNLKPGEEVTTDAMTRNAKIYFYAENQPSGWKWDGTNREGSRDLPIVNERFDQLEGEDLIYENPRTVTFYQVETGTTWTTHVETFECNPEASEPPAAGS